MKDGETAVDETHTFMVKFLHAFLNKLDRLTMALVSRGDPLASFAQLDSQVGHGNLKDGVTRGD